MKTYIILVLFIIISCKNSNETKQKGASEVSSDTVIFTGKVQKLAGGFGFTEGPAVDSLGNVYFTDIPNNKILIWKIEGKLDTFQPKSGNANGLYFDTMGNLIACESGEGRIAAYDPDGEHRVLADNFKGKRFNQPNDLWPDKQGGIYFTDPKYAGENPDLPQDGEHVYYIRPEDSTTVRVEDKLKKPNGVLGEPDGKTLYITDTELRKTFKYRIRKNGTLADKTLFIDKGSDGMTLDADGNLYLTTIGNNKVEVFSAAGNLLTSIEVPETPSNVCFGGKDNDQLFITARTSIYSVQTRQQGVDR